MTTEKSLVNFTPIFVLAGMMIFLIPIITEKALGAIDATAEVNTQFGNIKFTNIRSHLDAGKFIKNPAGEKNLVNWKTTGTGAIGGDERGYVKADVIDANTGKNLGTDTFYFDNPDRGTNTCSVAASDPHVDGGCSITQGFNAKAKYTVGFGR